ncbi:MAG: L-seryl-tRNA(Sec) selenium transferase [Hyphomicrobiaceae bacterium]|nr:L-seryl-tRNA(Sec) selenium transferase [Hyphomicrobiaceae bacterium]
MSKPSPDLPSVDEILRQPLASAALVQYGRGATVDAVRKALDSYRRSVRSGLAEALPRTSVALAVAAEAGRRLAADDAPRLRRVINLTGTVLHTNLGRAVLPEAAIQAAITAMRHPAALEFDLASGGRGERDNAIRPLLTELTGAEDAIVVNNNAAAVMLVLNTLGGGKETIVSRGELIEIGGAFRMPDIMARAGTRLIEVGTTNRTHARDYKGAIGPATGLVMKVHTSNYLIQGFTAEVAPAELASMAREAGVPFVDDLGSGTLVDLSRWGLKRERTVTDAIRDGADLVTFSGDKLLGGSQAGFIVGRRDLVQACQKNPMKRAMRLDKVRLAALEATLRLYRNPDRLADTLPTLRLLTRTPAELAATAERLVPPVAAAVGEAFVVEVRSCTSQIGSGALPLEAIASMGLAITPVERKSAGSRVEALAAAFRGLAIPVIGRIDKGALLLDLRCLDDEAAFAAGLAGLHMGSA